MIEGRELIPLTRDAVAMFRTAQFDAERGRIFDVVQRILNLRLRHTIPLWLCHRLTREHADLVPRQWRASAMRMASSLPPSRAQSSAAALLARCKRGHDA